MDEHRAEWTSAKDDLVEAVMHLGFPAELGEDLARGLGSPKAIRRLTRYVVQAKPATMEEIVDEMLAIRGEIDAWRMKKGSEEANARYNEILRHGLDCDS